MNAPEAFQRSHLGEMQAHAQEAAQLLKAMANEYRLQILCHLAEGEASVGELNEYIDLSQSSLSQHLAVLREYGVVETRRQSQTIYYRLADGPAMRVMQSLYDAYCAPGRRKHRRR
ncbi:MAG TPA: metalloregulator ArsR/SmtB family transcription factor [Arenicellales bacterium]|nr:metalloregulator ArsR/SmtB family transcription factor [Arenicellales bacterium]